MQDKINELIAKVKEFWEKYSTKQKTIAISIVAVVIVAFLILSFALSRTTYETLGTYEDIKTASEVIDLLKAEGVSCELADDNVTVMVDSAAYSEAVQAVGKSDIVSTGMSWEDALTNDMSTGETEKQKKTLLALQNELRQRLMMLDGIKEATVNINLPVDDLTVLTEKEEASVAVILNLEKDGAITAENANNIATWLAGTVGNTNTDKITILDGKSNLLFGGNSDDLLGGTVDSAIEYKQKLRNVLIDNVRKVLLKYGTYQDVEVGAANIKFDMNKVSELYTEYTPTEGQEQGVYSSRYTYKAEGVNGSGGTPGTDSNDSETPSYEVSDSSSSNSKVESDKEEFLPNEKKTTTEYEIGAVIPEESSMAIVLTSYNEIKEEDLERNGTLEGTTWEDYILQNDTKVQQEVSDEVYELVQMSTGIAANQLKITAWEKPLFIPMDKEETNNTNIIMIALAVLIVGLLGFVVFKSLKPVEVTEVEPELSVEELLTTTKEKQDLEDIEFDEKSETRKMIEKFVDENPEAVASLLRNWINEDWG